MLSLNNFKKLKIDRQLIYGGASDTQYEFEKPTEMDDPDCPTGCRKDTDKGVYGDNGARISGCVHYYCE